MQPIWECLLKTLLGSGTRWLKARLAHLVPKFVFHSSHSNQDRIGYAAETNNPVVSGTWCKRSLLLLLCLGILSDSHPESDSVNQAALVMKWPPGSLQKERRNPGIVPRFPHFRSEVMHFPSASLSLVELVTWPSHLWKSASVIFHVLSYFLRENNCYAERLRLLTLHLLFLFLLSFGSHIA